jgi:hypothetical protein
VGSYKWQELVFRFSNSGVVSTITTNPGLAAELSPKQDKHPPTFYSSKIVQSLTSGYELIKEPQTSIPHWVRNLKDELGMPNDALLRHLEVEGAAFGTRWKKFNLRFLGIVVEQSIQSKYSWPFWHVTDAKGTDIELIQVWYRRASCLASPVYCDIRWRPDRGETVKFPGLENAKKEMDVTLGWRGRILLQKMNPRGRPKGTEKITSDKFLEQAAQACRRLIDTTDEMPSGAAIATELLICSASFYRYMKRDNLTVNIIQDKAKRLQIEYTPPF